MAYFLVRVVVNALAAAIVMNVVPGLRILPYAYYFNPLAGILLYTVIGLIFGILHAFIRPVILFLSGRLYIWSMGLMALAADTFIFLLLSYVAPTEWQIGGTRLFSAILGAMAMGLIVMILEALTGLDSPHLMDKSHSPFYWHWLGMLPTGRRNRIVENLRTQQMVSIIRRYGVDILVGISPLGDLRRAFQRLIFRRRPVLTDQTPVAKVRLMLQELGPTFVKFGQMVAGRSETLPIEWQVELGHLQDDVAPFSFREVREIIHRELGKPPEEAFATFEPKPLAAASTAQVHAATLPGGVSVVVKVRRPNIEVTVKGDLNVMQDVLNLVERRVRWSRQFGMSTLFQEFAENVLTELDFANEAYNARLLCHNMQNFPFVQIPAIYVTFSTTSVLTQERVEGIKISDVPALDAAGFNREEVAVNFFRVLLQQVLFDGFFHADPHPGNVWVNTETGHVIFLDMGLMGYLALEDRFALGELIWALQDRDAQSVTRVLVAICRSSRGYDSTALQRDIERLVNRNLLFGDSSSSLTEMMKDLVTVLLHHGLQLRKEFTLAIKAIGQGESIMRTLMGDQPTDYILNVSYTQLKELLREQLTAENIIDNTGKPLIREIMGRLPALQAATTSLLDDFQKGQLAFQLNIDSIDQRVTVLQTSLELGIRRVVLSVLLVGLLLGSTLTLLIPFEGRVGEFESRVIRLIAESGFAISTLFIISLLAYTLWQTIRKPTDP
jgi:ubiquinone biosynthesis protein